MMSEEEHLPLSLGFDYSQSAIWSPLLVSRTHYYLVDDDDDDDMSKNLFESGFPLEKLKKFTLSVKNKISVNIDNSNVKKKKKKKKNKRDLSLGGVFASPRASPKNKGWNKALKVVSKPFKRQKAAAGPPKPKPITLGDYLKMELP